MTRRHRPAGGARKLNEMAEVIDMRGGIRRTLYAEGVLGGRRINSVSLEAEAWLWRCQLIADDYLVFVADPDDCLHAAGARRIPHGLTIEHVRKLLDELEVARLIRRYELGGKTYAVVLTPPDMPKSKNGRRVRKYPQPPDLPAVVNPGESKQSGGIQEIQGNPVNPGASRARAQHGTARHGTSTALHVNNQQGGSVGYGAGEWSPLSADRAAPAAGPDAKAWSGVLDAIGCWKGAALTVSEQAVWAQYERELRLAQLAIDGRAVDSCELLRRSVVNATEAQAGYQTHGKAIGYVKSIIARCMREGHWPGEFSSSADAARPRSAIDDEIDRMKRKIGGAA